MLHSPEILYLSWIAIDTCRNTRTEYYRENKCSLVELVVGEGNKYTTLEYDADRTIGRN